MRLRINTWANPVMKHVPIHDTHIIIIIGPAWRRLCNGACECSDGGVSSALVLLGNDPRPCRQSTD